MAEDARGARKAAFFAAALADRKGQDRLDGVDALVEVMAVERQSRFEPQRIARAEADRFYRASCAHSASARAETSLAGTEISNPSSPV